MGLCFRSTRSASSIAGTSIARFFKSVAPPLPFSPATRSVSRGSPACGTSLISIPRCVPTSTTSLPTPLESHSCAIAIAGKTCPPVPPPAINNFTARVRSSRFRRLLRNIQKHSGGQQHDKQTGSAIADEWERNSLCWHHAKHHREIDQRLAQHHGRDAQRQQAPKPVWRSKRSAHAAPAINDKKRNHNHRADKAKLLSNYGINKIGVRFRQIKELLLTLHQAHACKPAGTHGNQRLQQLKSGALRIRRRIEKGHEPRLAVRHLCDQKVENRNGGHCTGSDPFPGKARDVKNRRGKKHDFYRRAQIRLQENQHDANQNRSRRGKYRLQKVFFAKFHPAFAASPQVKKPRQIQDDGELCELRRLYTDGAKFDPAMRCVGLIEEQSSNQQQQYDAHDWVDHRRFSQLAIVGAHEQKHSQ